MANDSTKTTEVYKQWKNVIVIQELAFEELKYQLILKYFEQFHFSTVYINEKCVFWTRRIFLGSDELRGGRERVTL